MALQRRSRFPSRVGSQRRKSSWSLGPNGDTPVISATGSAFISAGAQALSDGLTHARLRGEFMVQLLTADDVGAGAGFHYAAGVCIVTENAFGAGLAAVPTPLTDQTWDGWLWYYTGTIHATSTTNLDRQPAATMRMVIDSKAMRKFKNTDIMIGVVEATEAGVSTMTAHMVTRSLVLLP